MKLGIVGLASCGKTTFFNALTQKEPSSKPSSKELNLGVVTVIDNRLDFLEKLYSAKKNVPATIEFIDIAGTNKSLLSSVREVDALVHVVRCFGHDVEPIRDIEAINLEFVLSDLGILEKRITKTTKEAKANKALVKEVELLGKLIAVLEDGKALKSIADELTTEENAVIHNFGLLSSKPVIYVANVALEDVAKKSSFVQQIKEFAALTNSTTLDICAQIEEEIAALPPQERGLFLDELGITKSGLERLVAESYNILGLMSFLTAGEKEVRAWTIKKGTKAAKAAGKIHSDIERGFIRAEIVSYDELKAAGTFNEAKKQGVVRLEGKDYIVKDGDVINFRFNV